MRFLAAIAATLLLAQCASKQEDDRFVVGQNVRGYVFIGVAEAADSTASEYTMLWRRVDPATNQFFPEVNGRNTFVAQTNSNSSIRIRGVPGEFASGPIEPGLWALDDVYAVLHDQRVNYYANGVVLGPDRPSFDVRSGQAVYLGIWELRVQDNNAVSRLWRLDAADLRALSHASHATTGQIDVTEAATRAIPCSPHRLNSMSQRQVC